MTQTSAESPITAPYGSWASPITSELIVSEMIGLGGITIDRSTPTGNSPSNLYWLESRPAEQGRNVLVRRLPDGTNEDVTPPPFNVRSLVHEYGGAAALIVDTTIYFSNFADQRLYRHRPGETPQPVTPDVPLRFADGVADRARRRGIFVMEDHRTTDADAQNSIAAVPFHGGEPQQLVTGADFYSNPRLSPDGTKLAWLSWNHPNMPWDGCELWVADVTQDGQLGQSEHVAGALEESIFQPEWSPDGTLYFVSDRTGWWNLYRLVGDRVEPIYAIDAEFGVPLWQFGMATYTFESADRIVCTYARGGQWRLATLDTRSGEPRDLDTGFTDFRSLTAANGTLWTVAASPSEPSAIVRIDLQSGRSEVLVRSTLVAADRGCISMPEAVEFPTENGLTAHAFHYAPKNDAYQAPYGELPPLIVHSHGGPTSATLSSFSLSTQYWTSRGFAVLDVNYGGSAGFGRAYRERLNGAWGIVDVDDCTNGARYLAGNGMADAERMAISGGSAGGYTTLCALTFRDVFSAGASHFGISDCEALATDTHKFESRYLDGLIGPYPERRDLYQQRSAIYHVGQISCPVAFFQGLEDRVVPPGQAEAMVDALRKKGLPVAYLAFAGEQHGFRQAANIKRALDGELYFYSRIFGFEPAGTIESIEIENL